MMLFQPPHPTPTSAAAAEQLLRMAASSGSSNGSAEDKPTSQASSRILYDIPCKVCTDHSSGKHYGIFACDGCAGFFKRSIRRGRQYVCKAKTEGACLVDKTHRNQCRACRLQRCVNVGMNKDAVQHERGPRNSTLRRQMSLYFKEQVSPTTPPLTVTPPTTLGGPTLPPIFSTASLLAPAPVVPMQVSSPPHSFITTPLSRPSPPFFAATAPPPPPPALNPAFFNDSLSKTYQLHLSYLDQARRNQHHPGLLMPTPKYPHEISPSTTPPAASGPAATTTPPPPPSLALKAASENVSEVAARLLFMNVKWAHHVPAFTSLPYRDQLLLLEESWRELFVLSAAQFALPVDLAASSVASDNENLLLELKNLQDTIQKFHEMNVDLTEFACLRAIILLKTHIETDAGSGNNDLKEIRDPATINSLQEQAQLTLSKYIANTYPNQPLRYGKLLLLLPKLKSITGKSIEELFFKKTIGAIPIERIICDMYKAGAA